MDQRDQGTAPTYVIACKTGDDARRAHVAAVRCTVLSEQVAPLPSWHISDGTTYVPNPSRVTTFPNLRWISSPRWLLYFYTPYGVTALRT
jgi:hypothetical protein